MKFSRRSALISGAALAGLGSASAAAAAAATRRSDVLDDMIVIDGNSAVVDIARPDRPEDPLSSRIAQDIKTSGLTAISMTIGQGTDGDRFGTVIKKIAGYGEKIASTPALMRIRNSGDILKAKSEDKLGLIYNVQDTMLLDTDISRIGVLQSLGIRIVQLTYNRRNLVGDGALEANDGGLSNFGHAVVEELNRQRLVIDLSHGGAKLIRQAIQASKAPPILSHSGCRALADLPRNVRDEEMRALADRGGVFGIYFMPFLTLNPPATAMDVIRHIEHAMNVCGEDHIAIGSDGTVSAMEMDAAVLQANRKAYEDRVRAGVAAPGETPEGEFFVPAYNRADRMVRLAEDLSRRKWPTTRIEKLFGTNLFRVFREVWG